MRGLVTGRLGSVLLLVLLLTGIGVVAETHEEIASKTGLDPDLFVELKVTVGGSELAIFSVYINERTFASKVSPSLRQSLFPFAGRNVLYVNPTTKEVVPSFPFFPSALGVEQEGKPPFVPTPSDWVEITPGFLAGVFQVNPAGASYGSGSEGILVLGDRIDPEKPFYLVYQGVRARFEIAKGAPVTPPAAAAPREPVEVPLLTGVTDLVDELVRGDFSSARVAALLGLDPTLVGTVTAKDHGEELRVLFINLEEGVRGSALRPDLLETVAPLIGTGAVMVWALSPTGASFSPWHLFIQQAGTNYVFFSASSFVELTEGFLRAGRVEPGNVLAGALLLPAGVNRGAPFTVHYGGAGWVTFPNVPPE